MNSCWSLLSVNKSIRLKSNEGFLEVRFIFLSCRSILKDASTTQIRLSYQQVGRLIQAYEDCILLAQIQLSNRGIFKTELMAAVEVHPQ